jgi:phosphoglucomutase
MTLDVLAKAREWTDRRFDEATRREIQSLIDKEAMKELQDRFSKELEFGTGGMRGIMAPGTNRMNIYTVGRATQGLADHLLESYTDARERGVAIAFDSRINSSLFAKEAAAVLAGNGIKARVFPELRPTPLLSFTVRHFGCRAGIVITASHNPKEYNGYKVYGPSGSQLTAPEDAEIVSRVGGVRIVDDVKKVDYADGIRRGLIEEIGPEVERAYLERVNGLTEWIQGGVMEELEAAGRELKILYTSLHGAGITLVPKALGRIKGVTLLLEEEQCVPDGSFPTTPSPNPEEGAALERAISAALEKGADMVIATDPDCDRMGLAVRAGGALESAAGRAGSGPERGRFVLLTGNQIGCLLGYLILRSYGKSGRMPADPVVISTIVSTPLVHEMARSFGVRVIDVLTGFKWIGEKMNEFEERGEGHFIYGFEESYGYLAGTFVRDKDGVIASVLAALLLKYAVGAGALAGASAANPVMALLAELYRAYGMFMEYGKSFTLKGIEGADKIKTLMKDLRKNPPERIGGGRVIAFKDYLEQKEKKPGEVETREMPALPVSDVLQFITDDGVKVSVRPSGTEPKIKFYFALREPMSGSMEETKGALDARYERLSGELFSALGLA